LIEGTNLIYEGNIMFVYLALVGVPAILTLFLGRTNDKLKKQKKQSRILVVFFALYFLLLAMRNSQVGVDLAQYLPRFRQIASTPWSEIFSRFDTVEPGYVLLNKVISSIWVNEQFFLTVVAAATVVPIAILYCKESEQAFLSISIFLILPMFSMFFSGLRQSLAIALVVPAYYFMREKKLLRFLLTVLLAYTFHTSALVLLLLYPLYHAKITKKALWTVIPGMAVIYIFNKQIFSFIIRFMGEKYADRYSRLDSTGAYSMLILFILLAIFAFAIPEEEALDPNTIGLRNLLLFSICLQCFAPINSIAMRMNYYYLLFLPLLIPKIITRCKPKYKQLAALANVIMCLFFICYFYWKAITSADILRVFDYIPFWEN
jgi:hypothetical protein